MDTCAGTTETASLGNAINLISRKWLAVSCGNQLRTPQLASSFISNVAWTWLAVRPESGMRCKADIGGMNIAACSSR
jgi:hypothetical protein